MRDTNDTPDTFTPDTVEHWVGFALSWAEENDQTPIHPIDLCEQMGGEFTENGVRGALNDLRKQQFVYRTPDGQRRLFSLSDTGKQALLTTGVPTALPSTGRGDGDPVERDLSMPDSASEFEQLGVPEKLYIDENTSAPHHLYHTTDTGDLLSFCKAETSVGDPQTTTPGEVADLNLCSCCTDRAEYDAWRTQNGEKRLGSPDSPPELFINDSDLQLIGSQVRHLWTTVNEDHRSRPTEFTPLCGGVRRLTRKRAPRKFSQPSITELDEADTCDACKQHTLVEEYRDASEYDAPDGRGEQSRWERYQEWIDERDFDETEFDPDRLLDEGRVLVSFPYTERGEGDRKLHAYQRVHDSNDNPTKYFSTLCGIKDAGTEHENNVTGMDPTSFVRRATACNRCATIIKNRGLLSTRHRSAEDVDYDPFGVFGDAEESLAPATSTASEAGREEQVDEEEDEVFVCPDCGKEYDSQKGLTIHWGHPKSDCEYPVPDAHERAIFTGLWMTGGDLDGGETPPMRKTSVNRDALKYINEQLGVWSGSVKEGNTGDQQQANVETGFGYEGAESKTQYRLTTRTCPWLERFKDLQISDAELTPEAARILYSFRGHLIDNSTIAIRHREGEALSDLLEDAGFEVRNVETPAEGKNQYRVTLAASAARDFADWIGEPLPGFENKAFEFREAHEHKEGSRTDDESTGKEVPDTISLEPEWDWVGVQLFKLGLKPLAIRAFNQDLSPAEVYGPGGVQDLIYDAARDGSYDLDMGQPFDGALTIQEQPVEPETVKQVKRKLGLLDDMNNGGDGNGEATA